VLYEVVLPQVSLRAHSFPLSVNIQPISLFIRHMGNWQWTHHKPWCRLFTVTPRHKRTKMPLFSSNWILVLSSARFNEKNYVLWFKLLLIFLQFLTSELTFFIVPWISSAFFSVNIPNEISRRIPHHHSGCITRFSIFLWNISQRREDCEHLHHKYMSITC